MYTDKLLTNYRSKRGCNRKRKILHAVGKDIKIII